MKGHRVFVLLAVTFSCAEPVLAAEEPEPLMARQALEMGRFDEAIEAARRDIAASMDDTLAWLTLGQALQAQGRYREALDVFRWNARRGNDVRIRSEVAAARIERLLGDSRAAQARLQRVLRHYDMSSGSLVSEELAAVAEAARLLADSDAALYHRSLRIYEASMAANPDNLDARVALGDLLLDRYNNEEALALYREVLERDREHPEALLGLARSRHFDHSRDALITVEQALALRPDWVDALVFQALLKIELEDYDAALAGLSRALEINPASADAWTLQAAVHFLRDDRDAFEKAEAAVLAQTPGYGELYVTLARIAAQNRRYSEAVKFARRAVVRNSRSWRARGILGINRLRLGQIETGRRNLETAFEGDPFDVWVRNTLDLLDRMRGYHSVRRGRFLLVGESRDVAILGPLLLPMAEEAYEEFVRRYGASPPTPIRIELFPRREDFSVRTVGLVGVDLLGVSFGPVVVVGTPSAGEFPETNIASTLWHELAHSFHLWISRHRIPRWFTEGLAVLEEHRARPGWGGDATPSFLRAVAENRLPPPSRLNRAFLRPSGPEELGHAYYQGYLILEFIETVHGEEAVRAFIEGYGEGYDTPALISSVLSTDADEFDRDFDAFLEARFGDALEALSATEEEVESPFTARWRAAQLALRDGDLDRAADLASEAKSMFPGFASKGSPYHVLAEIHRRRDDTAAAVTELQALLEINADDLDAHLDLAKLYLSQQRQADASRVWESALLIDPFNLGLRLDLADSYESGEQWSLAVRERRAVLALHPDDPVEARYLLARALSNAGMLEEAHQEVLATLENAPLYEDALELLLRIRELSGQES